MENSKKDFEYKYSAVEQEEIAKIKAKYMPQEESKLDQLRKLDASVTVPGTITGIIVGVIGCLVFGGGLSMILVVGKELLIPGVFLSAFGFLMMGLAYPLFKMITAKQRKLITPQILALTEDLE